MADIIIVRHGATDWNVNERFRGHADINLNETGRKQAYATAKRLTKIPVTNIYTSPLSRALETAAIIAQPHDIKPELLPALKDIDFGALEGLTFDEAKKLYADIYNNWLLYPHLVRFPGGESLDEVRNRAGNAIDNLILKLQHETAILVSHKIVINMLFIHLFNLNNSQLRQICQENCAINVFTKHNMHFYATLLNDTCHLTGIQ